MGVLTLELPDTLQHQLEGLARREGVQLAQYILYLLTRQITSPYSVQVVSPENIAQQQMAYTTLLQQWQQSESSRIDEILAKREVVEPEPELRPEIIAKLQKKITDKRSGL